MHLFLNNQYLLLTPALHCHQSTMPPHRLLRHVLALQSSTDYFKINAQIYQSVFEMLFSGYTSHFLECKYRFGRRRRASPLKLRRNRPRSGTCKPGNAFSDTLLTVPHGIVCLSNSPSYTIHGHSSIRPAVLLLR